MQNNEPKYTQAALGRFRKGLLKLLQDGLAECTALRRWVLAELLRTKSGRRTLVWRELEDA